MPPWKIWLTFGETDQAELISSATGKIQRPNPRQSGVPWSEWPSRKTWMSVRSPGLPPSYTLLHVGLGSAAAALDQVGFESPIHGKVNVTHLMLCVS
ncbi:uncharacterized protein CIMG_12816 [Coccidioides immitis RS]|uniref:Uncharacterized protein n=1 Tax=Coccidioides immitis (strain RS) TaxID=246410 RepID=J3KI28_COCIM|nr:uncharacterized protein CIMG_12816 [Coccidioides immitis RS]EAS35577.3 hypothetical protein CIMG_12816 [Coccidioides immitis RS]